MTAHTTTDESNHEARRTRSFSFMFFVPFVVNHFQGRTNAYRSR